MTDKRRGLGRGLGALIPAGPLPGADRPVDVFFPHQAGTRAPEAAGGSPDTPRSTGDAGGDLLLRTERTGDGEAALPGDSPGSREAADPDPLVAVPGAHFAEVPVAEIRPNTRQPRQVFDTDELRELVGSIREVGILQPVVVRPTDDDGQPSYELIMGERRWRAAQLAGLATVPAIVRVTSDADMLRDALLENLHRVQLNPLEEAAAFQQLLEDFECTHEELAGRVARSRPQISNTIRLLRLPPRLQRQVAAGTLSAGHARALLGLGDAAAMERLAERVVREGLSVRATEDLVAARAAGERRSPVRRASTREDARFDDLASRLSDQLAARVRISVGQRRGRIAIEFGTVEDLDRILEALALTPAPRETEGATAAN